MKQALRVAFGFLMLWAAVLHAEDPHRDYATAVWTPARPIGVVPFQWAGQGAAPEDVGGIVAADLRNSGKFNPLDRCSSAISSRVALRKYSQRHGLRWGSTPWWSARSRQNP